MANFTTHIAIGTLVAGSLATLTAAADVVAPENIIAVTLAGVVGSVLPDIDLKDSRPARGLFSGLAIFFSFCVLFNVADRYSIAEMYILWLGTLALVRYGGEALLQRFSYHRGIFHSVLAGLMFWFLTATIFTFGMGRHEAVGWLAGGFLFVGYMTHLLLDEIYSVDVMDRRLKLSFGSALKLIDAKHMGQTAVVAAFTVLFLALAPSPASFVQGLTAPTLWDGLRQRLVPDNAWFDGVVGRAAPSLVGAPTASSDVTTGSIAPSGEKQPRP